MSESMDAEHIMRLTESQRAYLRLVLAHQSSKEIAQQFGISAHTVDKRIKEAMRILGVGSRIEAAKILAAAEAPSAVAAIKPPSPIALPETAPMATTSAGPGTAIRRGHELPLPWPLFAEPDRSLSILQRAGWLIGLIIGLALATGIFLSGLTALSTLLITLSR